ncbi:MAG: TolC family protein [Synergistaceae bacterium]|jgi:outer membrane protein TolC|nr:TolC family protein [Synergistaceae bacterium]
MSALLLGAEVRAFAELLEVNIERALGLAIANNNRIKIAKSDVALAGEARHLAHRAKGVNVSVTHNSSYTDYQGEGYPQSYGESYSNSIVGSYRLYTGGIVGSTIKEAESDYQFQNEVLRKTHQDLKLDVVRGIYTILQTEDAVRQAEESVKRLTAHVDNVSILYENGSVGRADLLRSEVELSNAKQTLIRASSSYDTAVKQLNSLMGVSLDAQLLIDEKMTYEKYPHTLEECVSFARRIHPDLAGASHAIKSAKAGVGVAQGGRLPQASLMVTQNLGSINSWPGAKADSLSVGINIEFTVLDAGAGASKVSSAKESVQKAQYHYEQTMETVILAVNSDYNSIMEAAQRVEESMSAVGKAQGAYDIAVDRYNEGVGTNIDVVDSQGALTSAHSNHTQALCDYNIALANIEHSMGGPLE